VTPRLPARHVLQGDFFSPRNYLFSTPRKQKIEFRKQETEGRQNRGVENG
jgi:hypothetical protein